MNGFDTISGIIMLHVDEMFFFGSESFPKNCIAPFKKIFKIYHEESHIFKYIGISITQNSNYISLEQNEWEKKVAGQQKGGRCSIWW